MFERAKKLFLAACHNDDTSAISKPTCVYLCVSVCVAVLREEQGSEVKEFGNTL